jgi:hypothetical protein
LKDKGPDTLVKTDKSGKYGRWWIGDFPNPPEPGVYYAKILKKKFKSKNGTTIVCRADKSKKLTARR